MVQEYVDRELQRIVQISQMPAELSGIPELFRSYLGLEIHSIEFSSRLAEYIRNTYHGTDTVAVYNQFVDVALRADELGRETGERYTREDLITPQELALIQSGRGEAGMWHVKDPYQPIVLEKYPSADIGNLQRQRAKLGRQHAFDLYFGLETKNGFVKISLEPLDENGRTVCDPKPLNEDGNPIQNYTKSDNFPWRRD